MYENPFQIRQQLYYQKNKQIKELANVSSNQLNKGQQEMNSSNYYQKLQDSLIMDPCCVKENCKKKVFNSLSKENIFLKKRYSQRPLSTPIYFFEKIFKQNEANLTINTQNLLQVKTKLSLRNIESNTQINDTSRSKINIQDKNQNIQSPIQENSTQRSRTTTQNQINLNNNNTNNIAPNIVINNSSCHNPELQTNFGITNRDELISERTFRINMRRKSAEQHDDHINQYIKKYHNLQNIINHHEMQTQKKAEELKQIQINSLKRNQQQQAERFSLPNNSFRQRKSVLIAPEFALFQGFQNKKELKRLGSGNSFEIRPKRQTIPYSNTSQLQSFNLQELKLEKHSSSQQSSQAEDQKFLRTQSDLSKIYAINQFKETKKIKGKMSLVDNLLNQYCVNQMNNSSNFQNLSNKTEKQSNQKGIFQSNQQTTRPFNKQIVNTSLDRLNNHSNLLFQENKLTKCSSEQSLNQNLMTDPNSNEDRKCIINKPNNNTKSLIQKKNNYSQFNTLNQIFQSKNNQESLKQFASRHINQSFSLLQNKSNVRKTIISPAKATYVQVNTFSKFFSQKSPLLNPQKPAEKYLPPLNLLLKQQNSNNESQANTKSNQMLKYATYLSQKQNNKKKLYYSYLSRDASYNGSTSNQSSQEITKTEPSPQRTKNYGFLRKIF
ncbi:hypothetical protein ABPG74_016057 [Tetrahymena malaccensis]